MIPKDLITRTTASPAAAKAARPIGQAVQAAQAAQVTPHSPRRQFIRQLLTLAVLALLLAEVAHRTGILSGLDQAYSDLWHRVVGVRHVPQHTALIVLDEASLARYPDDPLVFWPPLFARATATLRAAGVQLIGIDFLFSITLDNWFAKLDLPRNAALEKYDLAFRQELNTGKLVLVGSIAHGAAGQPDNLLLPHADFLLSLPNMNLQAGIGLADLESDTDGVIRRYRVAPEIELLKEMAHGAPRLALSALLAVRTSGLDPAASQWTIAGQPYDPRSVHNISYAGPAGTIPRVSFYKLLEKDALSDPAVLALRGKTVIIGGNYLGMNDIHATPYSSSLAGRFGTLVAGMPGPEIQANILETLLAGKTTIVASDALRWGVTVVVLLLAMAVILRSSPWIGLLVLLAGALIALGVGYLAFRHFILFPSGTLQLALLAGFFLVLGSRLTREQRDKLRIRSMFEGYVSDDVVNMLIDSGQRLELGGQSTYITVLFSDIRNFTTISEQLSAQETIEFLNVYFERIIDVIRAEGGRIDKFIGDAVMAEFGVPYPFVDHELRALRAAIAMRAVAYDFRGWMRKRFPDKVFPEFAIGIGIHSGNAVVGNLGSATRMEYTAIGDTVNVASRLEGETKAMGCVIVASAATVRGAGKGLRTGRQERLSVKGRAEPLDVYEIIEVRSQESS